MKHRSHWVACFALSLGVTLGTVARSEAQAPALPVGADVEACGAAIWYYGPDISAAYTQEEQYKFKLPASDTRCEDYRNMESVHPWTQVPLVRGYVAAIGLPPDATTPEWQEEIEGQLPKVVATGHHTAMSVETYNALVTRYEEFRNKYSSGWQIRTVAQYAGLSCAAPNGVGTKPPPLPLSTSSLSTFHVIVRETPAAIERCDTLLMFTSPLNLQGVVATQTGKSLLIDPTTRAIVHVSTGRHARRAGYFDPPVHPEWCKDAKNDPDMIFANCPSRLMPQGVWHPIRGVEVGNEVGLKTSVVFDQMGSDLIPKYSVDEVAGRGTLVLTDDRGYYSAINSWRLSAIVVARIPIQFPTPGQSPRIMAFAGQAAIFPEKTTDQILNNQVQVNADAQATGTLPSPEQWRRYANIGVNIAVLQTDLAVSNEGVSEQFVSLGATTEYQHEPILPDCDDPQAVSADGNCDSKHDPSRRFIHQGLLKQISKRDLRNTDIYVFRESDGVLGVAQYGLPPESVPVGATTPVASVSALMPLGGLNSIVLGMHRGVNPSEGDPSIHRSIDEIRTIYGLEEKSQSTVIQGLRGGDPVVVVALNRATGYIATCHTTVGESSSSGVASFACPTMMLRPPNLRVRAQRASQVEAGATKDQIRKTLVGFEGSARTTDTYVKIETEWYDSDGLPLPSGLPGFQGRLARICSPGVVCGDGDVGHFEVTPNSNVELVAVPKDTELERGHFYVQIDARDPKTPEAIENTPFPSNQVCYRADPGDPGPTCVAEASAQAPLNERPADFVPFQVALFDKEETAYLREQYEEGDLEEEPEPVYKYFYRPEMQFSVLALELDALMKTGADGQPVDLTESLSGSSSSSIFLGPDDLSLELVLSILQDENPGLSRIDKPRHMVLLVGDREINVGLDSQQNLVIEDEDLEALTAEDIATLRLVQRYDEENVLWEYAFDRIVVGPGGTATGAEVPVSVDNPILVVHAVRLGYTDDPQTPYHAHWEVEPAYIPIHALTSTSNTLEASHSAELNLVGVVPGTRVRVSFVVDDQGATYSAWLRVDAGPPALILPQFTTGRTGAGGVGEVTGEAVVYDNNGNHVATGTPVTLDPDDDLEVTVSETVQDAGRVEFSAKGGRTSGSHSFVLRAGSQERTISVNVEPTLLQIDVPSEIEGGSSAPVTLTLHSAPTTTPVVVDVVALRGGLSSTSVSLLPEQPVALMLQTLPGAGPGQVIGRVGTLVSSARFEVTRAPNLPYAEIPLLVGDRTGVATFTVEDVDDQGNPTAHSEPFPTTSRIVSTGTPGAQQSVTLGTWSRPNRDPGLLYPLGSVLAGASSGTFYLLPARGSYIAKAENVEVSSDSPGRSGGSLRLLSSGKVTIEKSSDLAIAADVGFTVRIKPSTPLAPGRVVELAGSGQELILNANGTLTYRLSTQSGTREVTSDALSLGWHEVAAHHTNGEIILSVDGVVSQAPAALGGRNLQNQRGYGIQLGGGFGGLLRDFALIDWTSEKLLAFEDGTEAALLTFDAQGQASAMVHTTGAAGEAAKRFASLDNAVGQGPIGVAYAQAPFLQTEEQVWAEIGAQFEGIPDEIEFRLTKAQVYAKAFLIGFGIGECPEGDPGYLACVSGDVAASLFFWGDIRDLVKQARLAYERDPKFSGALAAVSALGLAVDALSAVEVTCAIATSETVVGGVACGTWLVATEKLNLGLAAVKTALKAAAKNPTIFKPLLNVAEAFIDRVLKDWFPPSVDKTVWALTALQFVSVLYEVQSNMTPDQRAYVNQAFLSSVDTFIAFATYWNDVLSVSDIDEKTASLSSMNGVVDVAYAGRRARAFISDAARVALQKVWNEDVVVWAMKNGVRPGAFADALHVLQKMTPAQYARFIENPDIAAYTLRSMAIIGDVGKGTAAVENLFLKSKLYESAYSTPEKLFALISDTDWKKILYEADGVTRRAGVEKGMAVLLGRNLADSQSGYTIRHAHMMFDALHEISTNTAKWGDDAVVTFVEAPRVRIKGVNGVDLPGRDYDIVITTQGKTLQLDTKTWGEWWRGPAERGFTEATFRSSLKLSAAPGKPVSTDIVASALAKTDDPLPALLLPFDVHAASGVQVATEMVLGDIRGVMVKNRQWYMEALGIVAPSQINGKAPTSEQLQKWWDIDEAGVDQVIATLRARGLVRFLDE